MYNFIIFSCILIMLVLFILSATYFMNIPTNDYEKHSAYECGFEPFGDARSFFDVHFYTIGLLFIIFDLEVVFLIPVVVDIAHISAMGYVSLLMLLLVVLIGFYYEWAIGLLNWVPPKKIAVNFFVIGWEYIFVLAESDIFFLIAVAIITISLFWTQSRNLIYCVVNLAFLSILIAGVWAAFTDLTFLYIVYILAFTGAIVMLFLSIILMLPASVTIDNYPIPGIVLITEITNFDNYALVLDSILYFSLLWLIIALCRLMQYLKIRPDGGVLCDSVIIFVNFARNITNGLRTLTGVKQFVLWLKTVTGVNAPTSIYGAFTKNSINMTVLPFFACIGLYWQNALYYVYVNIEVNLYCGISKTMYNLTAPVWGDLFKVLEYGYAPARSPRQALFPVPDIQKPYKPVDLQYSLFKLMPCTVSLSLLKYLPGNSALILCVNRIIFFGNFFFFFLTNLVFNFFVYLYFQDVIVVNLPYQSLSIISFLGLLTPLNFSKSPSTWADVCNLRNLQSSDSLLAIKEILYEDNALFLLLPAVVLLIALIGSAVLTRGSGQSKSAPRVI